MPFLNQNQKFLLGFILFALLWLGSYIIFSMMANSTYGPTGASFTVQAMPLVNHSNNLVQPDIDALFKEFIGDFIEEHNLTKSNVSAETSTGEKEDQDQDQDHDHDQWYYYNMGTSITFQDIKDYLAGTTDKDTKAETAALKVIPPAASYPNIACLTGNLLLKMIDMASSFLNSPMFASSVKRAAFKDQVFVLNSTIGKYCNTCSQAESDDNTCPSSSKDHGYCPAGMKHSENKIQDITITKKNTLWIGHWLSAEELDLLFDFYTVLLEVVHTLAHVLIIPLLYHYYLELLDRYFPPARVVENTTTGGQEEVLRGVAVVEETQVEDFFDDLENVEVQAEEEVPEDGQGRQQEEMDINVRFAWPEAAQSGEGNRNATFRQESYDTDHLLWIIYQIEMAVVRGTMRVTVLTTRDFDEEERPNEVILVFPN